MRTYVTSGKPQVPAANIDQYVSYKLCHFMIIVKNKTLRYRYPCNYGLTSG